MAHIAHLHKATVMGIVVGTGPAIIDPNDANLHFHLFGDNQRTSSDAFGDGHEHTINGFPTSIAIDIGPGFPGGIPLDNDAAENFFDEENQ